MNAPLPHVHTVTLHLRTPTGGTQPVTVVESPDLTLLGAMKQARGALPPTWVDGFNCHSGACNTCCVLINGVPGVPCTRFVRDLGRDITVAPGPHAEGWGGLRNPPRGGH